MRIAVGLVVLAACGSATPATNVWSPDSDEVVFGDSRWRVPGSVDHILWRGDSIVVVTQDGTVVQFAPDGARDVIVEGATANVTGVAWRSDHELALAGERPVSVDLTTRTARPLDLGTSIRRFAQAGARAIVGGERGTPLAVYDVGARKAGPQLEHSTQYAEPTIVGDWVVAGRSERSVGVWDVATGKRHRVFALGNASVFALSPDHALIATGSFGGSPHWEVDVHRVVDGTRTATIELDCNPEALAITPASDRLAIACDDAITLVALPGGAPIAKLPGPRSYVRALAWSPRGDRLAYGGNDHVLHLRSAPAWDEVSIVSGSRGEVRELAIADRMLVSQSRGDQSAWLWVTDLHKAVAELGGPGREIDAATTDGTDVLVAVTIGRDRERETAVERWHGGARVASVTLPHGQYAMASRVRNLGPINDGGIWYTTEARIVLLDSRLRPMWASVAPEEKPADGTAHSTRDGRRIVMLGAGQVLVVDGVARDVVASGPFDSCDAATPAVSPDGARTAIADSRGISVIDNETAAPIASLAFPHGEYASRAAAWRGRDQLTALFGDKLVAWDLAAKRATVMTVTNTVSLAFTGDYVYLGRVDGTIARRSFSAIRHGETAVAIRPVPACEHYEGSLSGMLRGDNEPEPRGRLDDMLSHDDE